MVGSFFWSDVNQGGRNTNGPAGSSTVTYKFTPKLFADQIQQKKIFIVKKIHNEKITRFWVGAFERGEEAESRFFRVSSGPRSVKSC